MINKEKNQHPELIILNHLSEWTEAVTFYTIHYLTHMPMGTLRHILNNLISQGLVERDQVADVTDYPDLFQHKDGTPMKTSRMYRLSPEGTKLFK